MFCQLYRLVMYDSGGLLLYNDQCKAAEVSSIGEKFIERIVTKANTLPECLPNKSKCVLGLFNILTSFSKLPTSLLQDCCLCSYNQHEDYNSTLVLHPACKTHVDVNSDNLSTIRLLASVKKIASTILSDVM